MDVIGGERGKVGHFGDLEGCDWSREDDIIATSFPFQTAKITCQKKPEAEVKSPNRK